MHENEVQSLAHYIVQNLYKITSWNAVSPFEIMVVDFDNLKGGQPNDCKEVDQQTVHYEDLVIAGFRTAIFSIDHFYLIMKPQ